MKPLTTIRIAYSDEIIYKVSLISHSLNSLLKPMTVCVSSMHPATHTRTRRKLYTLRILTGLLYITVKKTDATTNATCDQTPFA